MDGFDGGPVPRLLVALTAHVYVAPIVRPVTVIGLATSVVEAVAPPVDDVHVAVALVTAAPLSTGGLKSTAREPDAALAVVGLRGAAGLPTTTAFDATVAGPSPAAFVAVTVHV